MPDKILIVEDEVITAMDIKNMLKNFGFDVVGIASTGKDAINKAEEFKPDLVLMDISLKGDMDGIEAAEEIKSLHDIPVVYMSAFTDTNTFERIKFTNPYGFVNKPVSSELLLISIETAIYKHNLDKKLAESQEKLKDAHDNLELRVRERTAELENAYKELSDMYNNAPCGYHSLDKNGYFVKINNTELTWLGYTRDEIIGKKKFRDLVTDEGVNKFDKNYPGFLERGFVHDLEYDMIKKDGSLLTILLSATAIYDEDNNFQMSRSTIFDISTRKKRYDNNSE
jgi:PAS domain S-box-containing protein